MAEILQLTDLLDRLPRQLSGGERQRVALGRAMIRKPVAFLYDEPLSNLDAKLRVQMRVEIKELHAQTPTTAIYVTHDQVEAMTLGDRLVIMLDGQIVQIGTPLELYRRPNQLFVAGFIGSPSMNFLHARLRRESGTMYAAGNGFDLAVPHKYHSDLDTHDVDEVILGIRPEHISVVRENVSNDECFPSTLEVIEQLGEEVILNVLVGDTLIKVSHVSPDFSSNRGQTIKLKPDNDLLHFFSAVSGRTLSH